MCQMCGLGFEVACAHVVLHQSLNLTRNEANSKLNVLRTRILRSAIVTYSDEVSPSSLSNMSTKDLTCLSGNNVCTGMHMRDIGFESASETDAGVANDKCNAKKSFGS